MDTDILIVGGGLSGLALADQLERAGKNWQLVEASERLGGRILSPQIHGQKFDLGPAWFWPGQLRIAKLIQRFGLDVFEQFSEGQIIYQDHSGGVYPNRGFASMQGSLRIHGGMGTLIESFVKTLPEERIHLDTLLTALRQSGSQIEAQIETQIETQKGADQITAGHVVLAIAPRVAAATIQFKPTLSSDAINALQSVPTWMAGHAKVIAVYDQPYWRQKGFSGDAISQQGPMVEIHDASPASSGLYALFGFVGVSPTVRAAHHNKVIELAKAQLVTLFGPELNTPFDIRMQDWAQVKTVATREDEHAPNGHPAYGYPHALRNLWDGQLLFSSTEMGQTYGGFLEGALEAAEFTSKTLMRASSQAVSHCL
ncbi:MAG: FAD-dependent oxidoreductase [Cyanobacteria bacterium P01_F01_bin.150]